MFLVRLLTEYSVSFNQHNDLFRHIVYVNKQLMLKIVKVNVIDFRSFPLHFNKVSIL